MATEAETSRLDIRVEAAIHQGKMGTHETRMIDRLTLRADVVPSSVDVDARTFDITWSTGARVKRGFFEKYYEELSMKPAHVRMDRLQNRAPLLDAHNGYSLDGVLGVVQKAGIKKGAGWATVRFPAPGTHERADQVFDLVVQGILGKVSVGYDVHKMVRVEESDDSIPVYRAVDWEPYELSLVPMGADDGAGVRGHHRSHNPCIFVDHDEHSEDSDMKDKPKDDGHERQADAGLNDAPDGEDKVDVDQVRQQAASAERARAAAVRRCGKALELAEEFIERHIADGTGIDAFRALAIDERDKARSSYVSDTGRAIEAGDDADDKFIRGAVDWLAMRSGNANLIAKAHEQKRGEKYFHDPGEFRGLRMIDIARMCLERAGVRTAGMSTTNLVGRAFTTPGRLVDNPNLASRALGYQSTSDFPVLLQELLHKTLLGSYDTAPDTWRRWCAVGSVSDFRDHHRYRLGSFGVLDDLGEGQEFKNAVIPDGRREKIAATTKGNIISLTRQAIINDDMGSFVGLAARFGRAAGLTIEVLAYSTLTANGGLGPLMVDGKTLFHADHKNLGAGSALSVAGLDQNRVVMASQLDDDGNEILDLRPAVLIIAVGLGGQARVINEAQFDVDVVATENNKFMQPNKVVGLFRDIVDTPRVTGTRRYLLADPAVAPTIEVVFLDGMEEPFLEMQDGWRVDGAEWKVRLDVGAGGVDYRGAVTDAGA